MKQIAWMVLAGGLVLPSAYARDADTWDSTQVHVQQPQQVSDSAVDRADSRWDSTRTHVPPPATAEQLSNTTSGDTEEWDTTRRHVREEGRDATRTRQIGE